MYSHTKPCRRRSQFGAVISSTSRCKTARQIAPRNLPLPLLRRGNSYSKTCQAQWESQRQNRGLNGNPAPDVCRVLITWWILYTKLLFLFKYTLKIDQIHAINSFKKYNFHFYLFVYSPYISNFPCQTKYFTKVNKKTQKLGLTNRQRWILDNLGAATLWHTNISIFGPKNWKRLAFLKLLICDSLRGHS